MEPPLSAQSNATSVVVPFAVKSLGSCRNDWIDCISELGGSLADSFSTPKKVDISVMIACYIAPPSSSSRRLSISDASSAFGDKFGTQKATVHQEGDTFGGGRRSKKCCCSTYLSKG